MNADELEHTVTERERDWFRATSVVGVILILLALWGSQNDPTGDRFPHWVNLTMIVISVINGAVWLNLGAKGIREKR